LTTATKRPSVVEEVRRGLLDDLIAGKLQTGAKLPNENELADHYRVSRATVREAVQGLIEAGYVARRHGSGTYVTGSPRSRHALNSTVSNTDMIRDSGRIPTQQVIAKGVRQASTHERELLGLTGDDEQVMELERVMLADLRPVIYSLDRIPASLMTGIAADRLNGSLYVLLSRLGHPVQRGHARLAPTMATAKLARALDVKRGTPLLHIDQLDYDTRGQAVMLSLEWHVADAFEVIVNRRSTEGS
jgi:GntR family transcriptional regulator